jgi:hypothetical protein
VDFYGRRGLPVKKPRFIPAPLAHQLARKLQARRLGTPGQCQHLQIACTRPLFITTGLFVGPMVEMEMLPVRESFQQSLCQ